MDYTKKETLYSIDKLIDDKDYIVAVRILDNLLAECCAENADIYWLLLRKRLRVAVCMNDSRIAVYYADKVLRYMPTDVSARDEIKVRCNCALAYRLCLDDDNYREMYVTLANRAYRLSEENGIERASYTSLYSSCLFETGDYVSSYRYAIECVDFFKEEIGVKALGDISDEGSKKQLVMYMCNAAECAYYCSRSGKRENRKALLFESLGYIVECLNCLEKSYEESILNEVYCVAAKICENLSELYK